MRAKTSVKNIQIGIITRTYELGLAWHLTGYCEKRLT